MPDASRPATAAASCPGTSSAPSASIEHLGSGPTIDRCIGVAYVLPPDRFRRYLSAPRTLEAQLAAFRDELATAVDELAELLQDEAEPVRCCEYGGAAAGVLAAARRRAGAERCRRRQPGRSSAATASAASGSAVPR